MDALRDLVVLTVGGFVLRRAVEYAWTRAPGQALAAQPTQALVRASCPRPG